jgi:Spy/CpxP family protein refolding chaperone
MKKLNYSLLITLFAVSAIFAQPNPKANGNFGMQQRIKDKLNLNEQQVKKFDDIIFNQRKTAIDTKAELQKLQLKLRKMMNDNTVDENKLYGITDKISDLRSKRQKSRISTWLKIYNILDKEQKPLWTKAFQHFMTSAQKGKMGMKRKMRHRMNNRPNMPQRPMGMGNNTPMR